jgi:hypothetical protein
MQEIELLSPWTKKDGITTTMIGLWWDQMKKDEDCLVHSDQIIKFGFEKSLVYQYVDGLIKRKIVKSINPKFRTTKHNIRPTAEGVTRFLEFYRNQLKSIHAIETKRDVKSPIEVMRLQITCEFLEEIQTRLFSNPGK